MSKVNCCSSKEHASKENVCDVEVNVNVAVDVPKIIKYTYIVVALVFGILLSAKCFHKLLDQGYFVKK